jgi:hypothetical protein
MVRATANQPMKRASLRLPWRVALSLLAVALSVPAADFANEIRPVMKEFCLGCHSTEKHKGDLDLERFASMADVAAAPKVWEAVVDQISLGEMPPAEKPQPNAEQFRTLAAWANSVLETFAQTHAGDPGPVVLRRLDNAEYTYSVRDLTGVASLDPAKEFPGDSASGEGFMNVGNSLVMSPSLVTKYFDAAKDVASHAVLLPDGIRFSPSISARDWTEERLAAIRAFYARFTENGGGTAVNLQGIKFDTKDGGILPLEKYLETTVDERDPITAGHKSLALVAQERGLNAKYLGLLWNALHGTNQSVLLDPIRAQWRSAKPGGGVALVATIGQWQRALWRFTQVGHIGKRDGPTAWQEPVTPIAEAREIRLKIPASKEAAETTLYLVTSDAGDGNAGDFAVWENPRLVAPGRPELPLRDVRAAALALSANRKRVFSGAAQCLAAAAAVNGSSNSNAVSQLAQRHGVEPEVLTGWLECLGIGTGEARIDSHLAERMERAQTYDFIKGWIGADALSVIANSSDQPVRIPGNMKPHSVAVHPSPKLRVAVGWRSPVAASLRVEGVVQHAHTECGNGVVWWLEVRRGNTRQRLATGTAQDATQVKFGPFDRLAVQPGDVVSVVVGPRDGNHSCDLTAVDFRLTDGVQSWDLAQDVSPDILAGNPHADRLGHPGVWHFYSEPDEGTGAESALPAGSLLARWQSSTNPEEKARLAEALQTQLIGGGTGLAHDAPDAVLYRLLASPTGPLLASFVTHGQSAALPVEPFSNQPLVDSATPSWGLDPAMFGRHPQGAAVESKSLGVQAPSIVEVRLPTEFAEGYELVTTATLHQKTGSEGSVQMQVLTTKPESLSLAAGTVKEEGNKSTWSDGERPAVSDSPILVAKGSAARKRIETAFDEFRQLFPAALCYTKIVPVDEVVTLTLYYREDEPLKRLMLDTAQSAEIDRLWAELHFVSQDPLKLVDGFEQLWQFATQDADPSAFEPLREPIKRHAEEFRKLLVDTRPKHLDAVLKFAEGAYRRPLTIGEKDELRGLYRKLRDEEIPHDQAIRLTLARTLVSPAFLYRTEGPPPGDKPGPVNDWELATRLSYFLWSSAPDDELRAVAASGRLRDPDVLAAQTRRMLLDPRVRRLATEFGCAWLHIHDFASLDEKSERTFPTFNGLRGAMYEEAIRFFTDLFQSDASVLTLFDSDHTFLNDALAAHYGIPGVTGPEWRRVDGIKQYGRGGVFALGATLAKQSGASRTSPILRGNWVAEVFLGDKLPRPPKDVPRLPEDEATETLTVRQLTEKHSSDPKCFVCHRRIDAYGFSLEAFDAIGRRRDRDIGGRPIDTHAKVMDGSEIDGLEGLRGYLLTKRRDVVLKQFCRKLLGYSLGRAVMLSDGPLVSKMGDALKSNDYRITAAFETIVRSRQFREIRGKDLTSGK